MGKAAQISPTDVNVSSGSGVHSQESEFGRLSPKPRAKHSHLKLRADRVPAGAKMRGLPSTSLKIEVGVNYRPLSIERVKVQTFLRKH